MMRRVGLALLSTLALILVVLVAIFGLAQTDAGKRMIAAQLSGFLSTAETSVEINGLEGILPVDIRVATLTLADQEGIWLEVDQARLAWSPLALLAGRVQISDLSTARIALNQLPSGDEPSTEPFRLPELPTWLPPLTLERLEVTRIDLGRQVLGVPASFQLNGGVRTIQNGSAAMLYLAAERVDQPTASATLNATIGLTPPSLDLALDVDETGGLVAGLIGEGSAGDASLSLAGDGPLSDWRGELQANAQGLAELSATLGIALADMPKLTLDGALIAAPDLLPDDIAPMVGNQLEVAVSVVQSGAQQLDVERLHIKAAHASVRGDAEFDFDTEDVTANGQVEVADLAPLSSLIGSPLAGSLQVDLTADGQLQQPKGGLQIRGSGLSFDAITVVQLTSRVDISATQPLASGLGGVRLSSSGELQGLNIPEAEPLQFGQLTWKVDGFGRADDTVEVSQLHVSAPDIELALQGQFDPGTLKANGRVNLNLPSLATLARPFEQDVDGAATLEADFVVAQHVEQIDADLSASLERLSGLPPGAAELLGAAVELAASVSARPEGQLKIADLSIEGADAHVAGDVSIGLSDEQLDGRLSLDVPRLSTLASLLDQPIDGELKIETSLAGSINAPEIGLAARSDKVQLGDLAIENAKLRAEARDVATAPSGKVDLALTVNGLQANLSTPYRLDGERLELAEIALRAPRSQVDGALSVDLERTLVDGSLRGRVQDLAGLAPVLPIRLRGELDLDINLSAEDSKQAASTSLKVRDLLGDFGRLRRLEADAQVSDAMGAARFDAKASAQDFHQDDLHIEQAQVRADGTREQLSLDLGASGEIMEPFDLDARADVTFHDVTAVRLEQLSGQVASQPVRLAGPAEVSIGDRVLRVVGLDLRVADARVTADGSLAQGQVSADVALQELSLELLADLGAPDLLGQVDANLRMRGAASNPSAEFDLTATGLRAADPAFDDLPPAKLTAKAALESRRLRLDVRSEGATDKPLVLNAELPLSLQLEPFAVSVPDDPISGRLDAEVQLARLADIAGLDDDRLEGLLDTGLRLSGSAHDPQIDGTIEIIDGIYENGLTGTVLHDLTLRAVARQQQLTIEELSANDGGTGRLSGTGSIRIDPADSFPMDVDVTLTATRLVQTNDVDATVRGNLNLAGDLQFSRLTGKITVERADISIPDQFGPTVPTIKVEEIGGAPDRPTSEPTGGSALDLRLDVLVDLPGRVFVRGRGLESEWYGSIEAKGPATDPRLTGTLSIRRGFFDLLDRRFDLRRGEIEFSGVSPPNPTIDLEAVARAVDITAIISVEGNAKDPKLTLESEPPLPEDEVLSRLLFNREASSITPVQAVQLAAAVDRLRGGGVDVLGRLRAAIGVDTLDVSNSSDSEGDGISGSRLRAGKYLTDDVYVEAERGTEAQSGRARVEVEILPNLSLQADTGEDANSGVGLQWRFDY
ncbi:MAG: translocation/assembly module TamB domain-containing protein [Pseudomonadota bacterium]